MNIRHAKADLQFAAKKVRAWWTKSVIKSLPEVPTSTPNRYERVNVQEDLWVSMRDGVRLSTDVYLPDGHGPFPVVLIRMPYGKRETYCYMPSHGQYWAKKGYACVIQDVRGKWSSEGEWNPFVNEANDGYDTLDWVGKQFWCDGNIGMTGESYYGYTQLAAATTQHPKLKAIVPGDTAADIYGVWVYNGGALCSQTMGIWSPETNSRTYANYFRLDPWHLPLISADDEAGIPSNYYKEWINRPLRDSYWDKINVDQFYSQITIPMLSWGGWYDTFLKGTIDDWAGVRSAAQKSGNPDYQHLMIAGTDHEVTPMWNGTIGKLPVGKSAFSYDKICRFFDCYLKGIDNGVSKQGRVEIFVTGKNEWQVEESWPPKSVKPVKLFLHSGGLANTRKGNGVLSFEPPEAEPVDRYSYDPKSPVVVTHSENMWRRAECLTDRAAVEDRQDVLCYTTDALTADADILGPVSLVLFASSSAVDTDFTGALIDVAEDGSCHLLQEGIIRARFMTGEEKLLEPNKVFKFTIDMWATAHRFKKGHRIRLEVSSSNFDRYDRNLNNGERYGHSSQCIVAQQTVMHAAEHPSHLVLSVVMS